MNREKREVERPYRAIAAEFRQARECVIHKIGREIRNAEANCELVLRSRPRLMGSRDILHDHFPDVAALAVQHCLGAINRHANDSLR
jgi:hypothetical protein